MVVARQLTIVLKFTSFTMLKKKEKEFFLFLLFFFLWDKYLIGSEMDEVFTSCVTKVVLLYF